MLAEYQFKEGDGQLVNERGAKEPKPLPQLVLGQVKVCTKMEYMAKDVSFLPSADLCYVWEK